MLQYMVLKITFYIFGIGRWESSQNRGRMTQCHYNNTERFVGEFIFGIDFYLASEKEMSCASWCQ